MEFQDLLYEPGWHAQCFASRMEETPPTASQECERLRTELRLIQLRLIDLDHAIRRSGGTRRAQLMQVQERLSGEMDRAFTRLDELGCDAEWL